MSQPPDRPGLIRQLLRILGAAIARVQAFVQTLNERAAATRGRKRVHGGNDAQTTVLEQAAPPEATKHPGWEAGSPSLRDIITRLDAGRALDAAVMQAETPVATDDLEWLRQRREADPDSAEFHALRYSFRTKVPPGWSGQEPQVMDRQPTALTPRWTIAIEVVILMASAFSAFAFFILFNT